jgi:hypothetical protein
MSEVDGRFVKLGLWTNLDQGNVMGKTITTDSTTGAIVIALMAVLSTIGRRRPPCYTDRILMHTGTSYLWSIFLFVYHQIRANGRPADGLFHQQQALLRTLLPPSSLMAESTKLWSSRQVLPRPLWSAPPIWKLWCTVHYAGPSEIYPWSM